MTKNKNYFESNLTESIINKATDHLDSNEAHINTHKKLEYIEKYVSINFLKSNSMLLRTLRSIVFIEENKFKNVPRTIDPGFNFYTCSEFSGLLKENYLMCYYLF